MRLLAIVVLILISPLQIISQWDEVYQGSAYDTFYGLSFVNDSVGYTAVNKFVNNETDFYQLNMIWKTRDFGVTWDTIYSEIDYCQCPNDSIYHFSDVFFLSEGVGWACAVGTDRIWRTSDDGQSWQIIDTGLSEQVGGPMQASDFGNVVFYSANYGIVQNGNGGLHSMETIDGGETWTLNDNYNCWDISMVDSCDIGLVNGGVIKSISNCVYSTMPFPTIMEDPSRNGICIEYWNDQDFVCGATGLHDGSNFASVIKTTNGGASYAFLDFHWASDTRDIEFFDQQLGYMSLSPDTQENPDAILKTLDGGYSWYTQQIEQNQWGYPVLSRITCPSMNVAYGLSSHGVYRTLNGGGPLGTLFTAAIEKDNQVDFTVYPNPTASFISIKIPEGLNSADHIEIYDVNGHLIRTFPIDGSSVVTIDVTPLNAAVYALQFSNHLFCEPYFFIKE